MWHQAVTRYSLNTENIASIFEEIKTTKPGHEWEVLSKQYILEVNHLYTFQSFEYKPKVICW